MKTIVTEIPDYKTFLRGEKTLEIGYPWLTFGAIMAIEKILDDSKGQFEILEFGSGGSTIFFQKRCKRLVSFEHDILWWTLVYNRLQNKIQTSHNVYAFNYEISKSLQFLGIDKYDMVLVDGGANWKERQQILDAVPSSVKKGGWLIIDNYEHVKFDYAGWDVYTFDMLRYSGRGTRLCKKL